MCVQEPAICTFK